jgi:hypothetical protein
VKICFYKVPQTTLQLTRCLARWLSRT